MRRLTKVLPSSNGKMRNRPTAPIRRRMLMVTPPLPIAPPILTPTANRATIITIMVTTTGSGPMATAIFMAQTTPARIQISALTAVGHWRRKRADGLLRSDDNRMRAMAWLRHDAQSRVFCLQLGHDNQAWADEGFQTVVARGLVWRAAKNL